jgi:hypothetical protein
VRDSASLLSLVFPPRAGALVKARMSRVRPNVMQMGKW